MNARSPNSTDTFADPSESADARAGRSVDSTVAACFADAADASQGMKLIAAEILVAFDVGIVAVDFGDGTAPMMLVGDELLGVQIDRDCTRELLSGASSAPAAREIPLANATTYEPQVTRGLSVQLQPSPEPTSLLLVYRADGLPSAIEQVEHLKRLSWYADAIRKSMSGESKELPDSSKLYFDEAHTGKLNSALRDRQSLQLFHQDLEVDATAYRIANETRRLVRCDRVTVLLPRANRYRVRAMSGVTVVDSRSNSVRSIEGLIDTASVMSRPMIFPSDEPIPPQIERELDQYLDQTGVTTAIMLPLHRQRMDADEVHAETIDPFSDQGDIVAVLMLEYFSGDAPRAINPAISTVAGEAVLALQNSLEHDKIFGLGLWKFLGSCAHTLGRPIVAATAIAVVSLLIASALIPVDHYVIATGTTQPAEQRQVFAAIDGIVKKIHVADGQQVKAGDPLLELENSELESQAESLSGELLTTAQRLASIQAIRLSGKSDPSQSGRLVMEERQLKSTLANLRAQHELIQKQRKDLLVSSPIDGTVVAWQLAQRLSDRPIAKGNLLVSVVDQSSRWQLRLTVPDDNAGPVLEAMQETAGLPVRFAVATDPDDSFAATLQSLSAATRMDENGQHVVDLVASISDSDADGSMADSLTPFARQDARVGADVTAKIMCGRRTVLRSWFSDVFDFVDRNVWFYFR